MNISDLEVYARDNNVPIMQKEGIEYLIKYIKENNIKNILEIGCAIGYSSINMALIDKDISVTTIERDSNMYEEAIKNVSNFNLNDQIKIIYGDALDVNIDGCYDLIFIDGAKSQNIKFFNKYSLLLNDNGTIITDNINFHGLTYGDSSKYSRNLRQMVRKIREYVDFLKSNEEYDTIFLDIGDGIAISKKK